MDAFCRTIRGTTAISVAIRQAGRSKSRLPRETVSVPPQTAEKIIKASENKDSEVYLLKGADHTFNIFSGDMTAFDELCEVTVEWFVNTLYGA